MDEEERIMQSIPCPHGCGCKFIIHENFHGDSEVACVCPKCKLLVYVGY